MIPPFSIYFSLLAATEIHEKRPYPALFIIAAALIAFISLPARSMAFDMFADGPEDLRMLFLEGGSLARDKTIAPNITRGDLSRREVALTFDGGSEDGDAGLILDTLRKKGVKATIFLTGRFISRYPDVVRRIVHDGHEVGNHTPSPPYGILDDFETEDPSGGGQDYGGKRA